MDDSEERLGHVVKGRRRLWQVNEEIRTERAEKAVAALRAKKPSTVNRPRGSAAGGTGSFDSTGSRSRSGVDGAGGVAADDQTVSAQPGATDPHTLHHDDHHHDDHDEHFDMGQPEPAKKRKVPLAQRLEAIDSNRHGGMLRKAKGKSAMGRVRQASVFVGSNQPAPPPGTGSGGRGPLTASKDEAVKVLTPEEQVGMLSKHSETRLHFGAVISLESNHTEGFMVCHHAMGSRGTIGEVVSVPPSAAAAKDKIQFKVVDLKDLGSYVALPHPQHRPRPWHWH